MKGEDDVKTQGGDDPVIEWSILSLKLGGGVQGEGDRKSAHLLILPSQTVDFQDYQ